MASHLTAFLFASHGAGWPNPGQPVALRADHVLLDGSDGVVALLAFEALERAQHACELLLVSPGREANGPDAVEDVRYLQHAAASLRAPFVRPGAGPVAAIHRRRFAAPGRMLAGQAAGLEGVGAFASLAWRAAPLELAAALAGEPLHRTRPAVIGVRVEGDALVSSGGAELLELVASLLQGRGRDAVLECHGPGIAALPMSERIAFASLAPGRLGSAGVVFPSDERTRAYLRARGRDSEWRRAEGAGRDFDWEVAVSLRDVKPLAEAPAHVRVSPLAEDEELRALAWAVAGSARGAGLEVIVAGRAARAALEADGVFATLAEAGARVLDPDDPAANVPWEEGASLGLDGSGAMAPGVRAVSAAAWIAAGPAGAGAEAPAVTGPQALDPGELIERAVDGEPGRIEHGASHRVPGIPAPLGAALRGVVLLDAGDHARCDRILPWGPRAQAVRGDAGALAANLFRPLDEHFAARARAHGGGFLVAGIGYGAGEPADDSARALAAIGVRAVFARSFAPRAARTLALYGVLPLQLRELPEDVVLSVGDELEISQVADKLAPFGRLTVRHLTRGLHFDVEQDMDEWATGVLAAGGLLGYCARAGAPAAEGVQD